MEPHAHQPDLEPDERIASLVNEYFDRQQDGEELTPEQFASEHPELAAELQPYLEGLALLDQIRSSAPDVQAAMEAAPSAGRLPVVAGYDLMEEKGRGGMGVVYQALQISTKRIVGLKVLLGGPFASPAAQKRFEREVELAARLRHPSIVTVLESGQVSTGQQYFAMHYVEGVHLDTYVERDRPDVRSIVALFVQVCQAVEYAHDNGVVHRDLKPANVLIDDERQPHILDFGLAKAVDRGDDADSLSGQQSAPGQVLGTLKYLSPEQAAGTPALVDVRTDVYALGVMLYEALTGVLPVDTSGRASEVIRRILESRPKAPSLLSDRIDGELETIVLKALEKEQGHRYQSVGEIGEDLRRYLAGEPITAKRASHWYVLRKKIARNRSRIALAAAALMLGAVGLRGGILWSQHAMERQRAAELHVQRRLVLGIQRDLEAGQFRAAMADAITAPSRYPEVIEARLVAAQVRFEHYRQKVLSEEEKGEDEGDGEQADEGDEEGEQRDEGEAEDEAEEEEEGAEVEEEEDVYEALSGAIFFLKEQLWGDPSLWHCKALLAEIYRERDDEGDLEKAREYESEVSREAPDTAEAWYLRSFTKLYLNECLSCAHKAVARDDEHVLAWERLYYLAVEIKLLETAKDALEHLLHLDPDNTEWPVLQYRLLAKIRERRAGQDAATDGGPDDPAEGASDTPSRPPLTQPTSGPAASPTSQPAPADGQDR